MFSKRFVFDLLERAIKTFAQTLIAAIAIGVPIYKIEWTESLGIAATAALASALSSLASINAGTPGTASLLECMGQSTGITDDR